jgi:ubiquinone/menaquinone biosynthesis C-methylase UbiE
MMRQVRKPSKWTGRRIVRDMNERHSPLTDWGLSHVRIEEQFTILDVGCGGGKTVSKLAAMASAGTVQGVDYSEGSVAESRSYNAGVIAAKRVDIVKGSVSQLPFAENTFDLVTAIETQYYWPNLADDMREILRVLKPGGKLVVIAECYKGSRKDFIAGQLMRLLGSSYLGPADQRELFSNSGYSDVEVFEDRKRGWICAIGAKLAAQQ